MRLLELSGIRSNPVLTAFQTAMADRKPLDSTKYDPNVFDIAPEVTHNKELLAKFLTTLREKGFEPLDSGAFGAVFTHPDLQYVIKLFKLDPAYLAFVRYSLSHHDNPHVPRFRGKFIKVDPQTYAVRIEKLLPVPINLFYAISSSLLEFVSNKDQSAIDYYASVEKTTKSWGGNKYNKQMAKRLLAFLDKQPGLLDVLYDLKNSGMRLDLHEGNFMVRADGTWVIIDPFYMGEGEYDAKIVAAWKAGQ